MFSFLLLILIAYFAYLFILRPMIAFIRLRNQVRDMFGNAAGGNAGNRRSHTRTEKRQARKKKIDPSVGEYVSFEEINVRQSGQENARPNYEFPNDKADGRIEDAEWEDL